MQAQKGYPWHDKGLIGVFKLAGDLSVPCIAGKPSPCTAGVHVVRQGVESLHVVRQGCEAIVESVPAQVCKRMK